MLNVLWLLLIQHASHASPTLIIVNNTRFEIDGGWALNPYISNEIALIPQDSGNVFDKNKFRVGIRYKVNGLKLDPHLFFQKEREDDWKLEIGPTLRIDVSF